MCDGEIPSVFSDRYRKAHKDHKCCECRRIIKAGEKYHFAKGCWEGKWAEYKTCEECDGLREKLKDPYYGRAPFECLSEWADGADVEFPVKDEETFSPSLVSAITTEASRAPNLGTPKTA